jgi:hypothetical protein
MGLTAAYVLVRRGETPADVGEWQACGGTADGWSCYVAYSERDPRRPGPPWSEHAGPMLTAFVMDSDFCVLVGWRGGIDRFSWVVNESSAASYGWGGRHEEPDEQTQAAERAPVVAAMMEWASAAGLEVARAEQLDELLAHGYVLAEDGLGGLLAELGLVSPSDVVASAYVNHEPIDANHYLRSLQVAPVPVDVVDNHADTLPHRAAEMVLAAPIDHDGPHWGWFVREHELEQWGLPACIVSHSGLQVPAGGLTSWGHWDFYLASDPPIHLSGFRGALGDAGNLLPDIGTWHLVPEQFTADLSSALTWARQQVGRCLAPPTPDRERLMLERPDGPRPSEMMVDPRWHRAGEQTFNVDLYTYQDLADHLPALVDWFNDVRATLVDPIAALFGDRLTVEGANEPPFGPRYGATLTLLLRSTKERHSRLSPDDRGWQRALHRLRSGELRSISVDLTCLNGEGWHSQYRAGLRVSVVLRDQFTEVAGPLPDAHPARIAISVAKSLLEKGVPDGVTEVLNLARSAAIQFGAATGHAGDGGAGMMDSPYEDRRGVRWNGDRLHTTTRGVHWGNLLGPGHLAAIDGAGRLQQLRADAHIYGLEHWSTQPELWWYELSADPFQPNNAQADRVAQQLFQITPIRGHRP